MMSNNSNSMQVTNMTGFKKIYIYMIIQTFPKCFYFLFNPDFI